MNVFLVDDDPDVRRSIATLLEDAELNVHCFPNAVDCLAQVQEQDCDLVIADLSMRGMCGLTLLKRLKRVAPWVPVMLLTGFADIAACVRAIKLGAVDFVEKPFGSKEFLHKVKTVLTQDSFADSPASGPLSKIDRQVLTLLLMGRANTEIAYVLGRSLRTIERHRSSVYRKFKVDNIVDLVKKAAHLELDAVV